MNSKSNTTKTADISNHRAWTKPNGKPKRPLSAYNLYFQVERARILKNGMRREDPLVYLPEEVLRMSNWHKVRPRRPHRKSHGRVSFQDLARIISDRWKDLDERNRQVFADQAKLEKADYVRRVKEWEAAKTQQDTTAPGQQQSQKQITSTQRNVHTQKSAAPEKRELELHDLVSFVVDKPASLSFQTSSSSLDSLESFESLNLMNEEFFEVEISEEFHADMDITRGGGAGELSNHDPVLSREEIPDCVSTDLSSSTSSWEKKGVSASSDCSIEAELARLFSEQNLCREDAFSQAHGDRTGNDTSDSSMNDDLTDLFDDNDDLVNLLLFSN